MFWFSLAARARARARARAEQTHARAVALARPALAPPLVKVYKLSVDCTSAYQFN